MAPGEASYEVVIDVPDPVLLVAERARRPGAPRARGQVATPGFDSLDDQADRGSGKVEVDESPPARRAVLRAQDQQRADLLQGANLGPARHVPVEWNRSATTGSSTSSSKPIVFLRGNGVGLYETDHFFDLCDRNGILVVQDFMFSCGVYPSRRSGVPRRGLRRGDPPGAAARPASEPRHVVQVERRPVFEGDGRSASGSTDLQHLRPAAADRHGRGSDPALHALLAVVRAGSALQRSAPRSPALLVRTTRCSSRGYRTMGDRFSDEAGILGPASLPTMRATIADEAPAC